MNKRRGIGPLMIDVAGLALTAEDRELLQHPLVGGCILFSRNFESKRQVAELTRSLRSLRPELLLAVDYEGGRVQRFRQDFTRLPPMRALGAAHERDPAAARHAARAMGWLIGSELGEVGLDLCFAPVLDLDAGISTVIGDRALHADPEVVSALALQFCAGLRSAGMKPTGKHFPGHGQVATDSHEALPQDTRTLAEVQAGDLRPFAALIEAGLESVMMAHILFPAVDARPASLSPRWIGEVLRKTLGFAGSVFCDDLSMNGAASVGGYLERAEAALEAGCDMLPVCNHRPGVVELLDGLHYGAPAQVGERLARLHARPLVADTRELAAARTLAAELIERA